MILIVSQNQLEASNLGSMMADQNHASEILPSPEELASRLGLNDVTAAFIDVDSVSVDNRCIRDLTLKYPSGCYPWLAMNKLAVTHHPTHNR